MKPVYSIRREAINMEDIIAVCGAMPKGDELPQAPSEDDILADICSDALGISHQHAAGILHHQYSNEDYGFDGNVH